MNKIKIAVVAALAGLAFQALAAPEEYVTRSASGSTAATIYFEPGPRPASLLVADVTSDKAASVLSWRIGTNQLTLLAPSAADVTNTYTTIGLVASNAALVSVTAAGVVTPHNAFTNSFKTNALITLTNPLGTNVVAGDPATKVTSSYFEVISSTASTVTVASNATIHTTVGVGTNFLFMASPNQLQLNEVSSWVTNGANYVITLSVENPFAPLRAYILTNRYTFTFAALGTSSEIVLTNSTGLAAGDSLLVYPASDGHSLRQIQSIADYRYQWTPLKAVTGLALAAGDRLFVLDTALTTPVGAATLRLMADPVRVLPANSPAVLSVDGTSACAINAAIVRY